MVKFLYLECYYVDKQRFSFILSNEPITNKNVGRCRPIKKTAKYWVWVLD